MFEGFSLDLQQLKSRSASNKSNSVTSHIISGSHQKDSLSKNPKKLLNKKITALSRMLLKATFPCFSCFLEAEILYPMDIKPHPRFFTPIFPPTSAASVDPGRRRMDLFFGPLKTRWKLGSRWVGELVSWDCQQKTKVNWNGIEFLPIATDVV